MTENQTENEPIQPMGKGEGEMIFLYIRAEVARPDPERAALFHMLAEMVTGKVLPDSPLVDLDPGAISFRHVRLVAADEEEAYTIGWDLLPELNPDTIVVNDYVIQEGGDTND